MKHIEDYLDGVKRIAITGHTSPDGDCVGSCLGLWNYLKDNYPDITAHVYLQEIKSVFDYLRGADEIRHEDTGDDYDLMILLDISSKTRISFAEKILQRVPKTLCIDHHVTNPGGFTWFDNDPGASSASEVLSRYLDPEKISARCAECLYTGIVHDTGVFQYTCTSPATMRTAAMLMEKDIDFTGIIENSFFAKTYSQNLAMAQVITGSKLMLNGMVIVGVMPREERWKLGMKAAELDNIVSQLRYTEGVDVAVFLYQLDGGEYKVSLRSKEIIDVSAVAASFDGGGHVRAAGCMLKGEPADITDKLIAEIIKQLDGGNSYERDPESV